MELLERASRRVTSPRDANMPTTCFNPTSPKHMQSPPNSGSRLGRSPRDRMKIDHLLSSPRTHFSPRFGRSSSGLDTAPQRFTRFCETTNVRKPQNIIKDSQLTVK
eukprot:449414-Rhodomonas_salina.1